MHASLLLLILLACVPAALAQPVSERLATCLACHGESGTSQLEGVPSLGAQMPDYILVQLYLFREQQRVVAPMNEMAAGLSDDDLRTLSDTLGKLPAPMPAEASAEAGAAALATKYRCNSCHGQSFEGRDQIPRLAGQREDYLVKSLTEYKTNVRAGYDPAMNEVAQEVKEADIAVLAKYLASYR